MGENVVSIDPEGLAAEADAIAANAPANATPAPIGAAIVGEGAAEAAPELTYEQLQAIAAQSAAGLTLLIDRIGATFAPNWKITSEESSELGNAAAIALAAWFPSGAIPIKYMVLLNLAGTASTIVQARRDPETGELTPLKAAHTNKKQTPAATDGASIPA